MALDTDTAKVVCDGCGEVVDPRQPGTWREVVGLVQARKGGGAHGVKNQQATGRFFCRWCADDPGRSKQGALGL